MRIRTKKNKRAFTLVELIVSISIMSIMLLISSDITVRLMKEALRNDIRSEVDRNINFATETIKRNIISSPTVKICQASTFSESPNPNICNICIAGDCLLITFATTPKYFRLDSNEHLIQCNNSNNCVDPLNLTGNDLLVENLYFEESNVGFAQISFTVFDPNNIVYSKPNNGFDVITGVVNVGT